MIGKMIQEFLWYNKILILLTVFCIVIISGKDMRDDVLFTLRSPIIQCFPCLEGDDKCLMEISKNNNFCCKYHSDYDFCLYSTAVNTKNESTCYYIKEPLRSNCIIALSAITGKDLCDAVIYNQEFCNATRNSFLGRIDECEKIKSEDMKKFCIEGYRDSWER